MKVKEESEKFGLKLNIQKTKIMLSNPNTLWQIEGEKVEAVTDFIFLGSKITVNGDCSHEIKRHLLLGRKAMTDLESLFKSRDITLPTKVCIVKAMVFPVVIYRCETWTIAPCGTGQRSDAGWAGDVLLKTGVEKHQEFLPTSTCFCFVAVVGSAGPPACGVPESTWVGSAPRSPSVSHARTRGGRGWDPLSFALGPARSAGAGWPTHALS